MSACFGLAGSTRAMVEAVDLAVSSFEIDAEGVEIETEMLSDYCRSSRVA